MYRLVPCIPIFRDFFFLLKVEKGCVYVIMLKVALILFKIYVLMWKNSISRLLSKIAAKSNAGPMKYFKNPFGKVCVYVFFVCDINHLCLLRPFIFKFPFESCFCVLLLLKYIEIKCVLSIMGKKFHLIIPVSLLPKIQV